MRQVGHLNMRFRNSVTAMLFLLGTLTALIDAFNKASTTPTAPTNNANATDHIFAQTFRYLPDARMRTIN